MLVYIIRSERMRARSIREEHSVAIQANPAPTRDEPTRLARRFSQPPKEPPPGIASDTLSAVHHLSRTSLRAL